MKGGVHIVDKRRLDEVVARAVRERRQHLDLTQDQLAYLADVSEGSIRNIEQGLIVNPRNRTWTSLEAVLGWAPETLEKLRNGTTPIEVMPLDMLKRIIHDLILNRSSQAGVDSAKLDFRYLMSKVNKFGEFDADDALALEGILHDLEYSSPDVEFRSTGDTIDDGSGGTIPDVVVLRDGQPYEPGQFSKEVKDSLKIRFETDSASDEVEATFQVTDITGPAVGHGRVITGLGLGRERAPSPPHLRAGERIIARQDELGEDAEIPEDVRVSIARFSPGDRVSHRQFGRGIVVDVYVAEGLQPVIALLTERGGLKRFDARAAPIKLLKRYRKPGESSQPLSPDAVGIQDVLKLGQVIDHDTYEPYGSDNLIVGVLLLKKRSGRLSRTDRQHLAQIWDDLATALSADEETIEGSPLIVGLLEAITPFLKSESKEEVTRAVHPQTSVGEVAGHGSDAEQKEGHQD